MSGIPFPTLLSFYPYPQSLCGRCTLTSLTKFSGIDRFPFTQPAQLAVLGGCEIKVLAAEPCSKKREQGRGSLAASPLVTAPPSKLTRIYYNGSAAKSHSTTTQYRQLRRLPFTIPMGLRCDIHNFTRFCNYSHSYKSRRVTI